MRPQWRARLVLLVCYLLAVVTTVNAKLFGRSKEKIKEQMEELQAYHETRKEHGDVGHTMEAALVRDFKLRKKKRKGLLRKREVSLAEVLFPGVSPEHYKDEEEVFVIADNVQSKKTNVPFEFYDVMPGCQRPTMATFKRMRKRHQRKNLGNRLQGLELTPAPYELKFGQDMPCTVLCETTLEGYQVRWLRRLVEREYRVHMTFDQLPVLMRSQQLNYAVKGVPVGFMADTGDGKPHLYLYNHLKFTVTLYHDTENDDYLVTGFDVYAVSIQHANDGSTCIAALPDDDNESYQGGPTNDPTTYLRLHGTDLPVKYSYEINWQYSDLKWEDRWDVYVMNVPDDDIHFFSIVNSLMIVVFLTGAIATIMIRTLRKDIAAYNEIALMEEDGGEETGWKLVHGDVFRPPQWNPALLAVCVGTGAQIGTAFFITMLSALAGLVNPVRKGQTLTAVLVLYVLSGSVNGYLSARISKFCGCKAWKRNTLIAATALPGLLVSMFTVLNVFLSFAGAATAVPFWLLLSIFALWVCVSAPLVFIGAFFGYQRDNISIPVKTNQIARIVPGNQPFYTQPPVSFAVGGVLPFGSVCIEVFFILSALWLHQIYYVMGFLLVVLMILAATCAQVSVVMCYLQLCAEDHRWWWKSFGNCASSGGYLFLYALWFLFSRLELVGVLPVIIYLTYMGMISLCFGLFCGSVGFLCSFLFNKTIYGALKVD